MSPTSDRGPGVRFPPPLLFIVGFGIAWLLEGRFSFIIDDDGPGLVQLGLGFAAAGAGLALMFWGIATFAYARTAVYPSQPARLVVTTGPYRFTRNPMYVGLTSAYVGGALVTNWAWPLVLLPLVLWAVTALVIRREERYLTTAFGAEYAGYCGRVRRWL